MLVLVLHRVLHLDLLLVQVQVGYRSQRAVRAETLGADLAAQVHRVLLGEVPRHRRLGVGVRAARLAGHTAVPAREPPRVMGGDPVQAHDADRAGRGRRLAGLAHHQGAFHPVERERMVADTTGGLAGRIAPEVMAPPRAEVRADHRAALKAYVRLPALEHVVRPGGDLNAETGVADVAALVLVRGLGEVAQLRLDRLGDQGGPVRNRPLHDQVAQRVLTAATGQLRSAHRPGEPPEQAEQPPGPDIGDQRAVRRTAGPRTGDGKRHVLRRVHQVQAGGVGDPWLDPVREGEGLRRPPWPLERHGEVVGQPPGQPVPHRELRGVHRAALPARALRGRVGQAGRLLAAPAGRLGDALHPHPVVDVVQVQVRAVHGPVFGLVVRLGTQGVVGPAGPAQ
ncbi:hypothetical protein GCM10010518_19790 [Kitasatospora cinereorecta]